MPMAEDSALRAIREKQLAGEPLSIGETMSAGRDTTVNEIEGYQLKPDHVYRTVGTKTLEAYESVGMVRAAESDDTVESDRSGIDWYLGGAALKYGKGDVVVLEAPATPDYFTPAVDWGHRMAKDPKVRHMHSSNNNPVPMSTVSVLRPNPKS